TQVPSLSILGFAGATLTPAFTPETLAYTASVASSTTDVTLTAVSDAAVSVAVNSQPLGSGTVSQVFALAEGPNAFTITLTTGAMTRTYTVAIARAPVPALDGLALGVGALAPAFDPETLFYTGTIGFLAKQTIIVPNSSVSGAVIEVNGATVFSGGSSAPIDLQPQIAATVIVRVNTPLGESRDYVVDLVRQSQNEFAQEAYIKASNSDNTDNFGFSVALDGDTLVVGAIREDSATTGVNSISDEGSFESGAAYVFARAGTTWVQEAYLKAENTTQEDWFGWRVAVSGDTVAVGAVREDGSATGVNGTIDELAQAAGAVYIYVRQGSTWVQQAYIKASNTQTGDGFGSGVALSGETLVVGAAGEDSDGSAFDGTAQGMPNELESDSGAVYVYRRTGATWVQTAFLKSGNADAGDGFGNLAMALDGDTLAVGVQSEDGSSTGVNGPSNENELASGAAYVFVHNGSNWTQEAYIKASNTQSGDGFAGSVALRGDYLAVGASGEDSATTGINSVPNENAQDSGAVYLFVRSGTSWAQQAYVKAFNTGADDRFGVSVALTADSLAVCAPGEDGSASGINGLPDDGAQGSGAAYVFTRSGASWGQQFYVKASNNQPDGGFAARVAASRDSIAIGAFGEDSAATGINNPPVGSASASGATYLIR
ncbi:MAG: hypothetical protein ACJAUC_002561, partial [Planctomycetota bacterium]